MYFGGGVCKRGGVTATGAMKIVVEMQNSRVDAYVVPAREAEVQTTN